MDVTVVLELYGPWTTLFIPCVDLGFPKNRTLSLKNKKIKKGKSNPPPKKEVKEKKRKEMLKNKS